MKVSELDAGVVAEGIQAAKEGSDDNPYEPSDGKSFVVVITCGLAGHSDPDKAAAWDVGHALEKAGKSE